jgi:hypothetical protein
MPKTLSLWLRGTAIVVLAVATLGQFGASGRGQAEKSTVAEPTVADSVKLIEEQIKAYNNRDIEGFLKTYSHEIKLYDFPDKQRASGLDEMRTIYGTLFKNNPDLKATILRRIVQGEYVIDHEEISLGGRTIHGVAIYLVKEGKIRAVWIVK